MKSFLIFCLILNALSQGNDIDKVSAKISTIEHEKRIMQTKIKQLEEDVYTLEKRKIK